MFVCSISVHTRHPLTIEHSRVNWTSSSLVHSIMLSWRYATVVCQVWCCSLIHSSSQLCHVRSIGTFHHTHHSRMVSHTCVYFACDYTSYISVNFGDHTHCRRKALHRRGFSKASAGWGYVCLNSGASFQLNLGGQKKYTKI